MTQAEEQERALTKKHSDFWLAEYGKETNKNWILRKEIEALRLEIIKLERKLGEKSAMCWICNGAGEYHDPFAGNSPCSCRR